ncbi:TPA: hypothetical protein ACNUUK_001921 [Aeromonas salmonicida subsp. smithia]
MLTATLWVALGVIAAAFIARGVKISEFRQAWIDGLRLDISEYTSKAHEWIDLYIDFNSSLNQDEKMELHPKLERLKYDALHIHSRISLRFKPGDIEGDKLIEQLSHLLDPSKLKSEARYSSWRDLSDLAISNTRELLKTEWEKTKNPWYRYSKKFNKNG